jgi:predicted ArsR family transcriptional regulator
MENEFVASDAAILDLLLERESASVSELALSMQVTATAIRQRLMRLMAQGLVARSANRAKRGRPSHRYALTAEGRRKTGVNFADLAIALWREIGSLNDLKVKRALLEGLSRRLAGMYAGNVRGDSLQERMQSLAGLFHERRIPFTVDVQECASGPKLNVLACPYPELAEQDRTVCAVEREMFTEVLGANVRLDRCRLDGAQCCQFASAASVLN